MHFVRLGRQRWTKCWDVRESFYFSLTVDCYEDNRLYPVAIICSPSFTVCRKYDIVGRGGGGGGGGRQTQISFKQAEVTGQCHIDTLMCELSKPVIRLIVNAYHWQSQIPSYKAQRQISISHFEAT